MNYDESIYKEKANRRARKIWLVFAIFYQPITALTQQTDYGPVLII